MRHVTRMDASRTYAVIYGTNCEGMWMSHVAYVNELCRTYEYVTYMNESRRTFELVTSLVHSDLWHRLCADLNESCHTCEWVMSHICRSHVTHMNESCHTYEGVTPMDEACHTYEWVMSFVHSDLWHGLWVVCSLVADRFKRWRCDTGVANNTLQHTTLQHTVTRTTTQRFKRWRCDTAVANNTLQHTATHHTGAHCNTPHHTQIQAVEMWYRCVWVYAWDK